MVKVKVMVVEVNAFQWLGSVQGHEVTTVIVILPSTRKVATLTEQSDA